jgi:hypothetical protein
MKTKIQFVNQPLWVVYFSDKPGPQEFVYFLSYGLVSFRYESPSSLFNRSMAWINHELVGYYGWGYSRHVLVAPCEHIFVFSEECHQSFLYFRGKLRAYTDLLFRVTELEIFQFLDRLPHR